MRSKKPRCCRTQASCTSSRTIDAVFRRLPLSPTRKPAIVEDEQRGPRMLGSSVLRVGVRALLDLEVNRQAGHLTTECAEGEDHRAPLRALLRAPRIPVALPRVHVVLEQHADVDVAPAVLLPQRRPDVVRD